MTDQAFLEGIVKELVVYPDDVRSERKTDERGVLITLFVHEDDIGRIVGKEGIMAKAIRTLLRAFGAKTRAKISMRIFEPERDAE